MKFKDIADFLGFSSQSAAARHFGKSKQHWQKYLTGEREPGAKLVGDLTSGTNLMYEKIFFSDIFDHPFAEDDANAFYWLNLANEALNQCPSSENFEEIKKEIFQIQKKIKSLEKHLPDGEWGESDFETVN